VLADLLAGEHQANALPRRAPVGRRERSPTPPRGDWRSPPLLTPNERPRNPNAGSGCQHPAYYAPPPHPPSKPTRHGVPPSHGFRHPSPRQRAGRPHHPLTDLLHRVHHPFKRHLARVRYSSSLGRRRTSGDTNRTHADRQSKKQFTGVGKRAFREPFGPDNGLRHMLAYHPPSRAGKPLREARTGLPRHGRFADRRTEPPSPASTPIGPRAAKARDPRF